MLEKFLDLISSYIPIKPLAGVEDKLAQLDPDKIYVENVRELLNVSYQTASDLCELAVQQGYFQRGTEIQCPDGTVGVVVQPGQELPSTVLCKEEEEGFYKEVELPAKELEKRPFFKLNDVKFLRQTA